MKRNQMKFINIDKKLTEVKREIVKIDLEKFKAIPFNANHFALPDGGQVKVIQNFQIIDVKEVKAKFNKIWKQWFGDRNSTRAVGVLWSAFVLYVFPWLLDIAKVYCAFMIAQSFYKEHKGVEGKGGRNGFQSFVYYGKWLVVFHLIPIGVEMLDQIGAKMMIDIKTNPIMQSK
jgi:hypothetical protein